MLDREPTVILLDLLSSNWEKANTSIPDDPEFSTGWPDRASTYPVVSITNPDDAPIDGGDTGWTYMTGAGSVGQLRGGGVLVNGWAGTYDDLASAGPNGGQVSPKQLAWDFAKEIKRILRPYGGGTTNPETGDPELNSLAPGPARKFVDTGDDGQMDAVYRYEVRVLYTYDDG